MLGSPLPNGRPVTPQCLTPNLLQLFEMPANGFMPWDFHAHCGLCSIECHMRRPRAPAAARTSARAVVARQPLAACS